MFVLRINVEERNVDVPANYVIAHFGGKDGTVTLEEVAKRRNH
jgi:hypothetical protein